MSRQRSLLFLGLFGLVVVMSPTLNRLFQVDFSYTSPVVVAGLPLVDIRCPGWPEKDRIRAAPGTAEIDAGTACGWIAVGPIAVGGIAVGGLSIGVVSIGVGSFGVVAFGTLAVALFRSFGVLAIAGVRASGVVAFRKVVPAG